MKFHTFLAIFLSLLMIASSGFAETAPAPTAEEVEAALKEIPPATDEQKKAIRQMAETISLDVPKFYVKHFDVFYSQPKGSNATIWEFYEISVNTYKQILTGELKDKLPKFVLDDIKQSLTRLVNFFEKSKNIENLPESPEFKAFLLAEEQENIVSDAYLKREIGKTSKEFFDETNEKVGSIYRKIFDNIEEYPSLQAIQNDIEKAKTDKEKRGLMQAQMEEVMRLAIDEFTKKKE